jgi:beta-galactosidase
MNAPVFRLIAALAIPLALPAAVLPGAITVDASKSAPRPQALPFALGGRTPAGSTLAVNSRYLMLDGKPWFPVMGEFQYSRYPAENWEREILKMKAGGVSIVSTYIFWIHHEEIEGRFDWSGRRDLRRFVELAGKHGLYVWARIGPWDHGEVRNGGLPDWVLAKSKPRQNDASYLKYVQRFYGEIGRQLAGLFWKDGGPIVGVQIENEYHERGPGQGEEHILMLRKMARAAGMDAPFYSITGWDDAVIPARGVIPVFGGYPDGFWYRPMTPLAPSPAYFFLPLRADENVGDNLQSKRPEIDARFAPYPFLTAEMGGGMELSYHRRPLMSADDIAALDVTKLGSGVTLYGYYMFHGGTNPDGKTTTLQESQTTGYPQDLPLKSYDFQAPLGEYGQMHPSFRELKSIHLFLRDFGSALAPMAAYFPDRMPTGKQDRETPRVAVRSDSQTGYVFVNNYQKDHPLPTQRGLQVQVKLASGTVIAPRRPVDIPAGAHSFWPVNMAVGGAVLSYATAQPLCRLDDPDTLVFFAWPGIASEFVFQTPAGAAIESARGRVTRNGAQVTVDRLATGLDAAIEIRRKDGRRTQILLLSREQAYDIWKAPLAGRDRLIYSPADVYFDGDRIHLSSTDPAKLSYGIFPDAGKDVAGFRPRPNQGIFTSYAAPVEPIRAQADLRMVREPGAAPPVRMGKEVAMAPEDSAFETAGRWSIHVPDVKSPGVGEVLLRIGYQGDIARLYAGGRLITDDFYHGMPWEIGLREIPAADRKQGLDLQILPLRADAPIYLAAEARASLPGAGQVARVTEARLLPVYEAVASLLPATPDPTLGGFNPHR